MQKITPSGRLSPESFSHKTLVTAVTLALVGLSGSITAAEAGKAGDIASWQTPEYQADWGLGKMNAAYAYAQGITGKGIKVGVIDSGAAKHAELTGERFHRLTVKGEYADDGQRYPQGKGADAKNPTGAFKEGESFEVPADYEHGISDSHGTHVAGTVGANRDGVGMHGVAFGSDVYLASTGGNDKMVYGENQDYGYFKAAYEAMAREGVKIVNQSWGSATSNGFSKTDFWASLAAFEEKGKTFVDAAAEVALANDMIFVWTNGNNSNSHPYLRASLPYARPDIEKHWLTVAAANETGLEGFSGKAGLARWWTVTAPGKDINSAFVNYSGDGKVLDAEGKPLYKKYSGTSQAAPHAAGALALVMERFDYLTPTQARDVLLTTATDTPGGKDFRKTPDDKIGWGHINLKEAMRGPRQILGTLDVTMTDRHDVWTHDIVEDAWNGGRFVMPRSLKEEDKAASRDWAKRKAVLDKKVANETITDAEKAEYRTEEEREILRNARMKRGYAGELVKRGNGTLTLTGDNAFTGGVTIHEGTVAGLTNAFGTGKVTVEDGANLTVLKTVKWDELTEKGFEAREKTYNGKTFVSATLKDGATLTLENGVNLGAVTFEHNAYLLTKLSDEEKKAIRDGAALDWGFTMKGDWQAGTFVDTGLAFYDVKDVTSAATLDGRAQSTVSVNFAKADTTDFSTVARLLAAGNVQMDNWSRQTALRTEDALRDDFYAASQNVSLFHANRLMNAAFSRGTNRHEAKLDGGRRLWVEALGVKGDMKTQEGDADTQLAAGLFGMESNWMPEWTTGAYLAVGEDEMKLGDSKVKGDIYHAGFYLDRKAGAFDWRAAVGYTLVERESSRFTGFVDDIGLTSARSDLTVLQGSGQARYRLVEGERFSFAPTLAAGVMMIDDDGMTEKLGAHSLTRKPDERTVGFAKVGFEAEQKLTETLELGVGINYNTYFGDKQVKLAQSIDGGAAVKSEMTKLDNAAEVALDARWQPTKATRVGVTYEGVFANDLNEHGLRATLTYLF